MKLRLSVHSAEYLGKRLDATVVYFTPATGSFRVGLLTFPFDVTGSFTPGQEVEVSVTAVGRAAEPCMACKGKGGQYVGNVAGGVAHFDPCQYCRGTGHSVATVGAQPAEAAGEARPARDIAREVAHAVHPVQMATCQCDGGKTRAPGAFCAKATKAIAAAIEADRASQGKRP